MGWQPDFGIYEVVVYGGVIALVFYFGSKLFAGAPPPKPAPRPKRRNMEGKRDFTLEELKEYDGSDPTSPILMAVRGTVFDVTNGAGFYGPGGSYHAFAGREAARALGKGSTDTEVASNSKYDDLTKDELDSVVEWEEHYKMKYPIVGSVVQ
eukprot:TRINITY_DN15513_c0_g1_i1.p1 TRINITY_DN15513_c0_g1~~TRINITY_DN15513_c0_g1_i1.p1  ORF type:complete len:152 (+),score=30.20 TRINITY_DN15513_c0_g1_i1:74-529(+)